MHPKYETREDNSTIVYYFKIDEELKILVEFNIFDDDYVDSGQFREILARLIY